MRFLSFVLKNYALSQKFLPETTVDTATVFGLRKPIKRDPVEFAKKIKIMPIISSLEF